MAGTKEIKRRIKSVKNTKKITKAMELVAASKMKRAVASTLRSRLYAEYSWEILESIGRNVENIKHPFFEEGKGQDILAVVITSNRGLCGAYNAQIIKKAFNFNKKFGFDPTKNRVDFLYIGKKGAISLQRLGASMATSVYDNLPDNVSLRDISPIVDNVINEYKIGNYKKVFVIYTDFISALTQKPNIKQILPVRKESLREFIESVGENIENLLEQKKQKTDYLFEGDKNEFIGSLAEKLTKMQIYQMLLESNASEQSSRMVAMKNASEASGEMIDDLTLVFNKARQSNITREISEISAGMASIN